MEVPSGGGNPIYAQCFVSVSAVDLVLKSVVCRSHPCEEGVLRNSPALSELLVGCLEVGVRTA